MIMVGVKVLQELFCNLTIDAKNPSNGFALDCLEYNEARLDALPENVHGY